MSPSSITIVATAAALLATAVCPAAFADQNLGNVGVKVEETTTDFGRLHLNASLLGYQLSKPMGGWVSSASLTLDLHRRLAVRAHLTGPLVVVAGGEHAPWRAEGGLHLWASDRHELENEHIELKRDYRGDMIHKQYIDMPMVNHNKRGLGVGLIYNVGDATVDLNGTETTFTEHNLIAVVGMHAMNSTGYTVNVDGFGRKADYRWMTGGLDAMMGLLQEGDADDFGARWGGRLWVETIFLKPSGLAARIEIGKYPGHIGWVLGLSVGFGLHI